MLFRPSIVQKFSCFFRRCTCKSEGAILQIMHSDSRLELLVVGTKLPAVAITDTAAELAHCLFLCRPFEQSFQEPSREASLKLMVSSPSLVPRIPAVGSKTADACGWGRQPVSTGTLTTVAMASMRKLSKLTSNMRSGSDKDKNLLLFSDNSICGARSSSQKLLLNSSIGACAEDSQVFCGHHGTGTEHSQSPPAGAFELQAVDAEQVSASHKIRARRVTTKLCSISQRPTPALATPPVPDCRLQRACC